jgi:mono/diheme cytochrome c family protein
MSVWLKRIGYTVGAIVALALIVVSVVYGMSESRFRKSYSVAPEQHAFSADTAVLSRGAHLVSSIGCADCHGEGLSGRAVIDAAPMGRVVAPNLTSGKGGVGAQLTAESIERAVRHGVSRTSTPLLVMPSDEYQYISDADIQAIASYVHSLKPVDSEHPPHNVMLLPRALLVAGQLPFLAAEKIGEKPGSPMNVPVGVTKEYGGYLASIAGCTGCHGPTLSGGKIPGGDPAWGPAANITAAGSIGKWTEDQFIQTMRTGKRPDGSELKAPMPWQQFKNMTDDELRAIWQYLHSVPAKEFGNR